MLKPYRAPRWLPGRHLQTIYPAAWMPLPQVKYRREQWDTPDGDFIELDWLDAQGQENQQIDDTEKQPLVVLFHGLEGSSRSHYALRLMSALRQKNWRGVVVHFRGCGGTPNRLARSYHSGDSAEIDWILRRLRTTHHGKLYAVGVSLGGNTLLKWLGEQQDEARNIIDKAAAISAPIALPTTGHVLGTGFNRVYAALFLKTLRPKALAMIARHKLNHDGAAISRARNLWHYDSLFTAPLHGFKDADDYWEKSDSRPFLQTIKLPTLLLNARNDPFLPEQALPGADEVSEFVIRDFPQQGGHVGFVSNSPSNRQDWLPERILCFLQPGD
jgi:predicted alpha/beta-fold hydrolase